MQYTHVESEIINTLLEDGRLNLIEAMIQRCEHRYEYTDRTEDPLEKEFWRALRDGLVNAANLAGSIEKQIEAEKLNAD